MNKNSFRGPQAADSSQLTVAPSDTGRAAPAEMMPYAEDDALAGAFPEWDLVPPSGFIKRVSRKKSEDAPGL